MATLRILAIGDAEVLSETRRVLDRSEFEMHRVPAALAAGPMLRRIPFDLIIVVYPLADAEFTTFHAEVREPGGPCLGSQLLVLTTDSRLPELDAFHRDARLETISLDQPEHELAAVVGRYLGPIRAAPRYAVRLPVRWPEPAGDGETVNMSVSGALIAAGTPPAVGSRLAIEVEMPAGSLPLRLDAKVVRHSSPERESVDGFAIAYLRAPAAALERLENLFAGPGRRRDD